MQSLSKISTPNPPPYHQRDWGVGLPQVSLAKTVSATYSMFLFVIMVEPRMP